MLTCDGFEGRRRRRDVEHYGGRYISLRSIGLVYEGWLNRIGRVVVPREPIRGSARE
jgi:hypothetical protein